MEFIKHTQEDGKPSLECLDDYDIAVNDVKEKELVSIAMSSYYLLYR